MNEGWVKMHRKMLGNDALFRSSHTFTVWCWLLLNADYKTGEVTVGRFLLSAWLKIKPSTVYQTLKRLSNMNMIELKSNNKMTTVKILNWSKYQANPNTKDEGENEQYNNKVNEIQQQSNTIQEYKNKNKEYKEREYLSNIPSDDVEEFIKVFICSQSQVKSKADDLLNYCKAKGKKYSDYKAFLRNALKKDFGLRVPVAVVLEEKYEVISSEKLAEFRAKKARILGGAN